MKTLALSLFMALAVAAATPATADPLGVDLELSLGQESFPVFFLDGATRFGAHLQGSVTWTVNGLWLDKSTVDQDLGGWLEMRTIQLGEAAMVCAELHGRLDYGAGLGRDVEAKSCELWLPSDTSPGTLEPDDRIRRPSRRLEPQLTELPRLTR